MHVCKCCGMDVNMRSACIQVEPLRDTDGILTALYEYLWHRNQHGAPCAVHIPHTVSSALHACMCLKEEDVNSKCKAALRKIINKLCIYVWHAANCNPLIMVLAGHLP